jgi:DNA polymerase V
MYALVDGNNFFASCEQVFDPKLRGRALGVLSNNDGCIIARSKEAKKLGVQMAAPAFSVRHLVQSGQLLLRSANFSLYGDMSQRMMETAASFGFPIEIYSIDEAFLEMPQDLDLNEVALALRERILQWTGIFASVGIASTKTLAKLANRRAKKGQGVCVLSSVEEVEEALIETPVSDLWGIGRGLTDRLKASGVHMAYELKEKSDLWLKQRLGVHGQKIGLELRGVPSISLEMPSAKQSILSSRSFSHPVEDLKSLSEIIATLTVRAAEKLREEESVAASISVFVTTSRFQEEYYDNSTVLSLPYLTNSSFDLIAFAKKGMEAIFKPGLLYKRAGVMLLGLLPANVVEPDFLSQQEPQKHKDLMETVDHIRSKYSEKALFFGAQGDGKLPTQRRNSSQAYTTNWKELLTVKVT